MELRVIESLGDCSPASLLSQVQDYIIMMAGGEEKGAGWKAAEKYKGGKRIFNERSDREVRAHGPHLTSVSLVPDQFLILGPPYIKSFAAGKPLMCQALIMMEQRFWMNTIDGAKSCKFLTIFSDGEDLCWPYLLHKFTKVRLEEALLEGEVILQYKQHNYSRIF